MTEREVFLNFAELIFIGDAVILNADLAFFPLGPECSHGATSFLIPTSIFLDHGKFSIDITLKGVVIFDKIGEDFIVQDVLFLPQIIQIIDQISVKKLILMCQGP
jgi:hypothetical protein